ncbi:MAG: hypothetical protein ACR2QW_07095 [bacterium]
MFVSKEIVFLELQKTGCTHIRNLLMEVVGGNLVEKHNQLSENFNTDGAILVGSIRNPWEWYNSLWAYGCDRKGAIYKRVTRKRGSSFRGLGWKKNPRSALSTFLEDLFRHPDKWRRTYQDVSDAGAFREWLSMVHDPATWNDLGDDYGNSNLSKTAGLLTYRFLKLFCCRKGAQSRLNDIKSSEELSQFDSDFNFMGFFIRNESLENDLLKALELSGVKVSPSNRTLIMSGTRTNSSSRKYDVSYYYDKKSEDIVMNREMLVVKKFGYIPPSHRNEYVVEGK